MKMPGPMFVQWILAAYTNWRAVMLSSHFSLCCLSATPLARPLSFIGTPRSLHHHHIILYIWACSHVCAHLTRKTTLIRLRMFALTDMCAKITGHVVISFHHHYRCRRRSKLVDEQVFWPIKSRCRVMIENDLLQSWKSHSISVSMLMLCHCTLSEIFPNEILRQISCIAFIWTMCAFSLAYTPFSTTTTSSYGFVVVFIVKDIPTLYVKMHHFWADNAQQISGNSVKKLVALRALSLSLFRYVCLSLFTLVRSRYVWILYIIYVRIDVYRARTVNQKSWPKNKYSLYIILFLFPLFPSRIAPIQIYIYFIG